MTEDELKARIKGLRLLLGSLYDAMGLKRLSDSDIRRDYGEIGLDVVVRVETELVRSNDD